MWSYDAAAAIFDTTLEPGTRDSLLWLRSAYLDGLIPSDFAVLQQSQIYDMIRSAKAGGAAGAVSYSWSIGGDATKVDPAADLVPVPYLKNEEGVPLAYQDSGFFGMFVIPKSVPEDRLKRILAFMDYGASEEGATLANYGFEGVHYNVQDGFKVSTEQATKDIVAAQAFGQLFTAYDPYQRAFATGIPMEKYERNKQVIDTRSEISIPDPATGLISETDVKLGPEFNKKIQDLKVKIIMDKEPIAAWDSFVEQLKADKDYQAIIAEINEAYRLRDQG